MVKVFEAFFLSITSVLLFRFAWKLTGDEVVPWLTLLVFFLPSPSGHPFNKDLLIGMESGVNALMLLLMLNLWLATDNYPLPATRFFLLYGLVLGLTFLARLDNIFLILGIACLHLRQLERSRETRPELFKKLGLAAAISFLLAGTYLLWNMTQFGHLVPMSGRVLAWYSAQTSKSLLAQGILPWLLNTFWFLTQVRAISLLPLAGLTAIPFVIWLSKKLAQRQQPSLHGSVLNSKPLLLTLWGASAFKIAYYALFEQYPYNAKYWYYIPEALVLTVCSALVLTVLIRTLKLKNPASIVRVTTLAVMLVSAGMILRLKPILEWETASYRAVPEISKRVGPDALIGAKDAGVLGYFLPNPVVNLDGLVNDDEFFQYLQGDRVREYILKENVLYIANLMAPTAEDRFTRMMGKDRLELLYRSSDIVQSQGEWVYKLYRVIK